MVCLWCRRAMRTLRGRTGSMMSQWTALMLGGRMQLHVRCM